MESLHGELREYVARAVGNALCADVRPERVSFRTRAGNCTLNILGYGVETVDVDARAFGELRRVEAVESVAVAAGHVNVTLNAGFFSYLLEEALRDLPCAQPARDNSELAGLARTRMLMLARQRRSGLTDSPPVRRAMWLAFAACDPALDCKRRRLALEQASAEALGMTRLIPRRTEAYSELGDVGDCIARMLSAAWMMNRVFEEE
ncbi:MAG: hypothetical protein Q4B99_05335 [Clostridia bacterium]|nr:hypothetical protein [Clostridia bacterium]